MKYILALILFISVYVLFSDTAFAQVKYEDVIEKIHYTDGMSYEPTTGRPAVVAKEIGSSSPVLKVYIYGDFSETYTKKFFSDTFDYLKNKYQDARFLFRNAVFMDIDEGMQVAATVNCLAEQNQFWDNINNLINTSDLNNPDFKNIDKNKFDSCRNSKNTKLGINIENDLKKYYGFNSVPTLIIQNALKPQDYVVKVSGAQSTDIFDRAFLEAKEGDLTKRDLEEIKAKVNNLQQDVEKTKQTIQQVQQKQSFLEEQISVLKQLIDKIIKNFQSLFGAKV